ncbi:hypothetical protein ACFYNO_14430 [Kitasatospora sp. NPDC006697]|uniref:hypothetical protein n=1 Tax=unclassified Kitasatospora TaxID=2633591 RepID=UPI00367F2C48
MEKPLVIVRDECWELLESGTVKTTPEREATPHGIGKEQFLEGLIRQNRQGKPPLPFTG